MKRLLSALVAGTLALSAVGATAASAQSWGGRHHGYSRGYGGYGYGHRNNDGAILGLGLGLLAFGAIAAASSRDRYDDRYYDRHDYAPPPPPSYRYGYGYRY